MRVVTVSCNAETMGIGFAGVLGNHHAVIGLVTLIGLVAGFIGLLYGDAVATLAGFGVMALGIGGEVVTFAYVTVPAGLVLIFAAVGVYFFH